MMTEKGDPDRNSQMDFDRVKAKEARQQRVTRSLKNMENEANELVAFLDDQRDRRRTINILVPIGNTSIKYFS